MQYTVGAVEYVNAKPLIKQFERRTGEALVLNTSFNVMGEPIVNHPREAIRCFYDNGLDVLVMGDFVLRKN